MSRQLASILNKSGRLSVKQVAEAWQRADQSKRSLRQVVLEEKLIGEETLAETLSEQLRIPHMRLAASTIDPDAVRLLPEEQARKFLCLPIKKELPAAGAVSKRATLVVAMADPTDLIATQEVEFASGCAVKPVVVTASEVKDAIDRYFAPEDWVGDFMRGVEASDNFEIFDTAEDTLDVRDLKNAVRQTPIVKMVNLIIQNAIKVGASDIHIEAGVNHVQVRNRQQGLLREYLQLPKWVGEPLVSRIKILAKLDISERRQPQDGRLKVVFERLQVDLRVSTLPTHFGEKVVMRILGAGQTIPATSALGITPEDLDVVLNAADQPQGLILVTGPTGSGKTTTLYALLNEKKRPDINIVTVEDPIEFQIPGINQVQVNTKAQLTFAASLRSILRQDPDVILVGEIRDLETAEIAFHAAMTGHLVLSTLHANSTAATISRLLDLGVEPSLISASLSLVVAQRLLRKLCVRCREQGAPSAKQLARLQLEDARFKFFRAKGCVACDQTGYVGRIGIYELLRVTPAMRELIGRRASSQDIQKGAVRAGTVSLLQQAIALVRDSVTSVDEVLRVVQLQEEEVMRCPNCGTLIDRQFSACPYCTYALKMVCESCDQELKPNWRICPYCSAPVKKQGGLGATETPALPAAAAPVADPNTMAEFRTPLPAAETSAETAKSPRILVVDDDEAMRAIVGEALSLLPNDPMIREASSGPEALAAVGQERPDLILLDVMMPGMTGLEVCQKLRSNIQTAFVPILMLTSNIDEASRSQGFTVGTDDYMNKPVSIPELHARVTRLLRRTYGM
jgi:type IV pilus assembly protein PilB